MTEQGASIYSCSDIAKKEFPDMNINLISAGMKLFKINLIISRLINFFLF